MKKKVPSTSVSIDFENIPEEIKQKVDKQLEQIAMNNEAQAQLYEAVSVWVKASDELPEWIEKPLNHLEDKKTYVCIKADGLYFSAWYNHDEKVFEIKSQPKVTWKPTDHNIHWLRPLPNHVAISVERLRELEKCLQEIKKRYNTSFADDALEIISQIKKTNQ